MYKDCTIRFEGRTYAVPFAYVSKRVEVRGCSGVVQIVDPRTGRVVKQYPRGTEGLLLVDQGCYEGAATDGVKRPRPLGRMARRIEQLASRPVQLRSIDFYAELAEVAR